MSSSPPLALTSTLTSALAAALTVVFPTAAWGFCGTYVGQPGAEPTNQASQIAIGRDGNRTTLTMANDYVGPIEDFGILIPIPPDVTAADVVLVPETLFDRLDAYSAPRVVRYTCDDLDAPAAPAPPTGTTTSGGCGGGTAYSIGPSTGQSPQGELGEGEVDDVAVEARFTLGGYEIAILEADDGTALEAWLALHDFALDDAVDSLLQDYIDTGTKFLAARIAMDAEDEAEPIWLAPIQIQYSAPTVNLPIQLGTLSSVGIQDLVIYVAGPGDDGAYAIANYDEFVLDDACMIASDTGDWYDAQLDAGLSGGDDAQWMVEYAWEPGKCDPCTGPGPLDDDTLATMGYPHDGTTAFFTRLHMRYAPDQVFDDLVVDPTFDRETRQIRLIAFDPEIAGHFEPCVGETFEATGTCDVVPPADTGRRVTTTYSDEPPPGNGCLCSALPLGANAAVVGFVVLGMRRRRAPRSAPPRRRNGHTTGQTMDPTDG